MADLNDLQSAGTVKLVGSDGSGAEQTPIQSTTKGEIVSSDILNTSAVQTTLTLTTTAVEARVGLSNLTGRKVLMIQAQTSNVVWGFSSGSQPFTLASGASLYLSLGESITLYLKKTSGSGPVVIAEIS